MNKKPVETIMGIVVIFVAAFFLFFAYLHGRVIYGTPLIVRLE